MKTYPSANIKLKIECFIDSALKKEMSWDILASIIDNMTPTLDKCKEVIKILLEIMHDKEELFDDNLDSNDKVDNKIEVVEIEENENDENNCLISDELLGKALEVNQDSCIDFVNHSQNDKVLLETTVAVSTDIQIVENLEDQFFVLLENDPDKELSMKSGKETNLMTCIESSDSDLEDKEKSFRSKKVEVEKNFQCEICQKLFRKKHKLTEHKKFHSDEKKFQCPSCGKCFEQSCDLKRH